MIPKPAIWMMRLSLINLLIASAAGGLILAHKTIGIHPAIWSILPVHYELAIWGWLVQFVMGTAYWMFPKMLQENRRGPEAPAWFMVFIFNSGLFILAASSFIQYPLFSPAAGRALILISILIFALLIWPRVVTYRNLA
jgi:hypothetical protein